MEISARKKVWGTAASLVLGIIVVPGLFWLICAAIDDVLNLHRVVFQPWSAVVTAACVLVGVFWILWSWSYLLYVGKGLPLEVFGRPLHPTKILVMTGPYSYTRNPMVLGLLFILLAVAFFRGTYSGFVGVVVVGLAFWIYLLVFEEQGLIQRFGADYDKYRRGVPLLFPKLSAYVHNP
jgi:protein-S-isoprenylcysteine O-methyltransferase Ste14